jgi:hypothetical protein
MLSINDNRRVQDTQYQGLWKLTSVIQLYSFSHGIKIAVRQCMECIRLTLMNAVDSIWKRNRMVLGAVHGSDS